MLENIEMWIAIASAVLVFLGTAIPLIIALVKKVKAVITASDEAASAAAILDMQTYLSELVVSVEELYAKVDVALKAEGDSSGEVKKETVLSKLSNYANENGYTFDSEYWSKEIDSIIAVTNSVNV